MKKTDDQRPKQEQLFTALKQYFSHRHLNMLLQVQLNLKKVSHIHHFPSLVHSISTLDFTVILLLCSLPSLSNLLSPFQQYLQYITM